MTTLKHITLITTLLLCCNCIIAQQGAYSFQGSRSAGLASISSTLNSVNAVFNNFSNALLSKEKFGAIIGSQRRFSLSELSTAQMGAFKKIGSNNAFGVSLNTYGFTEYREHKLSLSYARRILENLSLSVNFDYNQLIISENGEKAFFTYGIGLSGKVNDKIGYAAYIFNFENSDIATQTESNAYIQLGFYNIVSKKIKLHAELEKYIKELPNLKLGIEYSPISLLDVRLGFNTLPGTMAFGFSVDINSKISLDADVQYNNLLGTSPSIGLKYLAQ